MAGCARPAAHDGSWHDRLRMVGGGMTGCARPAARDRWRLDRLRTTGLA
ncbi:hypothetical protein ACFQ7I_28680 [Streptomyces massasporeus]